MTLSLSKRYALWFSAVSLIILSTVMLTTIVVISRNADYLRLRLRQGTVENLEAMQQNTMFNLAEYLRRELFEPLYELDIERITLSLKDLRRGMPIVSVCIADASGKVLTDGTWENPSYGTKLKLDPKALSSMPIMIEKVPAGRRIVFQIGIEEYVAGYGEIIFSDVAMRRAMVRHDETAFRIWGEFKATFLKIGIIWAAFIALLTLVIGVFFSRTLSGPLIKLRNATGRIAQGDLDYRVVVRSRDEVGDLAESFNKMVGDLQQRTAELGKTNEALQTEVAERKKAEEAITYQAYHDVLTGLANRMLFMDRLTLELAQARRRNAKLAVFFLDLDRFKSINDTLGHDVGDALLKEAAFRLKKEIRISDTIARIGGDEFNILLTDLAHPEDIADVARKILEPFGQPFSLGGHTLQVTMSIGISIFPNDGEYAENLLKNADIALYHVKQQGGNGFQFYDPAMNTATIERIILENSLRRTLERGELVVHYQPQIDVKTGNIICAEALVRWRHPELGMLLPERFIPLAEEIGFITTLDEWVLRTVCRQISVWRNVGPPYLCFTVNVSARQFQSADLVTKISNILKETGTPADCLDLEITESMAMSSIDRTITQLRELANMGIHVSIDDFGTGYSSLNYLKRLPIQRLKIDKSFIHDIATDADDRAIIDAVTAMAHTMKMKVIAEGVETEDQLAFLRDSDCDEAQGFLFSEALPADKFRQLVLSR